MTMENREHILELIEELQEEAAGSRGQYYELYGSAIQPALEPLAQLLSLNLEGNGELVELVLLSLGGASANGRIEELRESIAERAQRMEDPRGLWRFDWDLGRQGAVESIFVATRSELDAAIGSEIYFGEILGKHSEVSGVLEESDLTLLTEDEKLIELFLKHVGSTGHSPLDYLEE